MKLRFAEFVIEKKQSCIEVLENGESIAEVDSLDSAFEVIAERRERPIKNAEIKETLW